MPRVDGGSGARLLRLRGDEQLTAMLTQDGPVDPGTLELSTRESVELGELVRVEISFGAMADEVELSGTVSGVDRGERNRVRIRISSDHKDRVDYVRGVLSGLRPASARNHRRVPADLAARWRSGDGQFASRVRDLSRGGAFLESRTVPDVGSPVEVEIEAAAATGSPGLVLSGVVSWVRQAGRDSGFGVCFKLRDREAAAALNRVVRWQERSTEAR